MNDTSNKLVRVGDRVRWESAAGTMRGEVVEMYLGLNAREELVPWLIIEHGVNARKNRISLCGNHGYLKSMKFTVTFRDLENQLETV
jgi:hypothetical protein